MSKASICFVVLVVVLAFAEATMRQCRPICQPGQPSPLQCVRDTHSCRRMRSCSVAEVNCRRRLTNTTPLQPTHPQRCRYIKGVIGSGQCAPIKRIPRDVRPNCSLIRCNNPSKKLNCYRSRSNRCQLLTACQLSHVNCQRGSNNALSWVDSRQCNGMKSGQPLQPCRRIPRTG